jgi:hypothetical protein
MYTQKHPTVSNLQKNIHAHQYIHTHAFITSVFTILPHTRGGSYNLFYNRTCKKSFVSSSLCMLAGSALVSESAARQHACHVTRSTSPTQSFPRVMRAPRRVATSAPRSHDIPHSCHTHENGKNLVKTLHPCARSHEFFSCPVCAHSRGRRSMLFFPPANGLPVARNATSLRPTKRLP